MYPKCGRKFYHIIEHLQIVFCQTKWENPFILNVKLLKMIKWYKKGLLLTLFCLTACNSLGPSRVKIDRVQYNDIVQETDNEQLLKNIVRLRYLHSTNYLSITNVTSSYNLNRSLSVTNVSENSATTNMAWGSIGITPGVSYSDSPTISYVPVTDGNFIRSMQRPVPFDDFILLSRQASFERDILMTLLTQKIDDLDTNLSIVNNKIIVTREYYEYNRCLTLLAKMFQEKAITLQPYIFDKKPTLVLEFKKAYINSPEALELKKILHIPSNSPTIILMEKGDYGQLKNKSGILIPKDTESNLKNVVYIQLRSINATLVFVSRGVEVPESDLINHSALAIQGYNGIIYSVDPSLRNFFTIYNSEIEPQNDVLVKTYVHNHWFYIKDSDTTSKVTFDILVRLVLLTAAISAEQQGPALTLPIG